MLGRDARHRRQVLTRAPRLVFAATLLIVLTSCQGTDDEDVAAPQTAPTETDGAYCGLVSTDLVDELLGSGVEVETRTLVTASPGPRAIECRMSGDTPGTSYVSVVADPETGSPGPTTVAPQSDGCRQVDVEGWGPVTACRRDTWVSIAAFPPGGRRFLSIAVRLDEPGVQGRASDRQLEEMTDAGVRVAKDVLTHLDRF